MDARHICVNTIITNDACTVHTFPHGVECFVSCPHSSDSGGVIAATVVSVLVVAGIATVIVIILVVHMQRKKKTKRRYSFTKSTETVYLNVSTTMPAQVTSHVMCDHLTIYCVAFLGSTLCGE